MDRADNSQSATVSPINIDTTAPTTTTTQTPAANANGWNRAAVTVTLTAADKTGGSGVRDITYSLSGAQTAAPRTVTGVTASTGCP